ncbi:Hypothetical_protein [Hexamita inflata]|uniref:Hypothetical_protein n=1 Tax=Hexamita inflata TaxID=28002 RepID=A0AA86QS03_9EUKA|nr:Hypothetical protein HINF_LOCUS22986 [Hexamita inflata]CAI9961987.1 Hypothetical protein HINF_LOCUS49632 [Hexamita inflata]
MSGKLEFSSRHTAALKCLDTLYSNPNLVSWPTYVKDGGKSQTSPVCVQSCFASDAHFRAASTCTPDKTKRTQEEQTGEASAPSSEFVFSPRCILAPAESRYFGGVSQRFVLSYTPE